MAKTTVKPYSLKNLFSELQNGDFAIPEIQRQFVWNKQRICDLMDSIYNDYPIGVSLVWSAPFSKSIQLRPNTKSIIPTSSRGARKNLIIDGQQRLSAIYGVLSGHEGVRYSESQVNFKELFLVCDPQGSKRFRFSTKLDDESVGFIRLTDALTVSRSKLKSRLQLKKYEVNALERCVAAFNDYKFYLLFYRGSGLEKDIREIFVRINSRGMTVSRADILFARANRIKLRDHVLEARRSLNNGYDGISIDAIQATIALAYGAKRIGVREFQKFLNHVEKNKHQKEFAKIWKNLRRGYEQAADFLVNVLQVKTIELLPSQNIFSLLAFFFYLNRSRATSRQTAELKKWFWHTSCGNRYSGAAFNKNIPSDIEFFRRLAKNAGAKYVIQERINPQDFLKTSYKATHGASSANAYYIMLRTKKPKFLDNGHEMILDSPSAKANRKDRHHIFPSALIRNKGIESRWTNSIVNVCYLSANENQSISSKPPRHYLLTFKRKRHFGGAMKSCLIPSKVSSPIWEGSVKQAFLGTLNLRGKLILKEIERLAGGVRIFDTFDAIKRL